MDCTAAHNICRITRVGIPKPLSHDSLRTAAWLRPFGIGNELGQPTRFAKLMPNGYVEQSHHPRPTLMINFPSTENIKHHA